MMPAENTDSGRHAQPLITGFTFNEPAAFGPFDINATSPTPTNGTGPLNNLACGVKRETK